MVFTEVGMEMEVTEEHKPKAYSLMAFTEVGIEMEVREEQE